MGIPAGVIDLFSHPPLALLLRSTTTPTTLFNPYSGSGSLDITVPNFLPFLPPKSAFGFRWSVNSSPSEAGRTPGAVLRYEQTFFSFALHYQLGDGSLFTGDSIETGLAEGFWLFQIALPSSLTYHILEGWTLHFDWLVGR